MQSSPRRHSPASSTTTDEDTRDILDSIRRIVRGLRMASRLAEKELGLSGAQLFVLQKLAEGPGGLSINDLASRTLTHQSSVSVVVARLVEQGLVDREPAADDRRRVVLTLTSKGRSLLKRAPALPQERLLGALRGLPPAELRALSLGLGNLVRVAGLDLEPASLFFEEDIGRKKSNE